jgi:hypothetical protein
MKIKSSIGKNVSAAVANCREVLVTETINLLKQIGAEQGDDVLLKRMLILFQTKPDGASETIVCNRIAYADGRNGTPYYIISMGKDEDVPYRSDLFLSLSNLQAIYDEVRRVVREY